MEQCPNLLKLIEDNFNFDHLVMIRMRNLIDGMVVPHRDFIELDPNLKYFRVFLPLEHNIHAYHPDESGVFQMLPGEIWFLDAAITHSAINFSNNRRMFMCLDYIFKNDFSKLDIFKNKKEVQTIKKFNIIERIPLLDTQEQEIIKGLEKLLETFTFKELLFATAKYHFKYDIKIDKCFDWLIIASKASNKTNILNKVINIKKYLIDKRNLKERFVINQW